MKTATQTTAPAHTPGVCAGIKEKGRRNCMVIRNLDIKEIAVCRGSNYEADAARIADCWNACEGIANPADLRLQRDELLAACKSIIKNMPEGWSMKLVQDAIAKAEGRA